MDDKVMIIFYKEDEDNRSCSFYTTRFAEWIKLLEYAKRHDITFYPREDAESIKKEYIDNGCGYYLDDYCINFGDDTCIQTIGVYLK